MDEDGVEVTVSRRAERGAGEAASGLGGFGAGRSSPRRRGRASVSGVAKWKCGLARVGKEPQHRLFLRCSRCERRRRRRKRLAALRLLARLPASLRSPQPHPQPLGRPLRRRRAAATATTRTTTRFPSGQTTTTTRPTRPSRSASSSPSAAAWAFGSGGLPSSHPSAPSPSFTTSTGGKTYHRTHPYHPSTRVPRADPTLARHRPQPSRLPTDLCDPFAEPGFLVRSVPRLVELPF